MSFACDDENLHYEQSPSSESNVAQVKCLVVGIANESRIYSKIIGKESKVTSRNLDDALLDRPSAY